MADAEQAQKENVQRQLAADRAAVDKSNAEFAERAKGKPTPTQEENDRAKLGEHILEHEDDGSGPDPFTQRNQEAQRATVEGQRALSPRQGERGAYQTRSTTTPQPTRTGGSSGG